MYKLIKIISYLSLFVILFTECSKYDKQECLYAAPPSNLLFILKLNGKIYPDSILNNLKISYNKSGTKKYLTYFGRPTSPYKDSGIIVSQNIDILNTVDTINTFYLEYPFGQSLDSFYVNYLKPSNSTNCIYKLQNILFNNKNTVLVDASFKLSTPVYIFSK